MTERFSGVPLNQFGIHLQRQMVQNYHAKDLDLFDRHQTRLHSQSRMALNQLPAHSAGKSQLQSEQTRRAGLLADRTKSARVLLTNQKENQCQEN